MINFTMLAHNRPRLTRQALESLARSLSQPDEVSVTVLHDGSNRDTVDTIDRCLGLFKHATLTFAYPDQGTGALRNMVIKSSEVLYGRGTHLYLSDNDVFVHRGCMETMLMLYELAWARGFRVLGAYNHPFHIPVAAHHLWQGWAVNEVSSLALQSMLMKWSVWDEYGPFADTTPGKVCDGEDVLFGNKIREAGFKLGVINPPLVVNCGVTNSFGQPIPGADLVKAQAVQGVIVE